MRETVFTVREIQYLGPAFADSQEPSFDCCVGNPLGASGKFTPDTDFSLVTPCAAVALFASSDRTFRVDPELGRRPRRSWRRHQNHIFSDVLRFRRRRLDLRATAAHSVCMNLHRQCCVGGDPQALHPPQNASTAARRNASRVVFCFKQRRRISQDRSTRSNVQSHSMFVPGRISSIIIRRIVSNSRLLSPGSKEGCCVTSLNSAGIAGWCRSLIPLVRQIVLESDAEYRTRYGLMSRPTGSWPPRAAQSGCWPTRQLHCHSDAAADDVHGTTAP
jgi:hypothetical protein